LERLGETWSNLSKATHPCTEKRRDSRAHAHLPYHVAPVTCQPTCGALLASFILAPSSSPLSVYIPGSQSDSRSLRVRTQPYPSTVLLQSKGLRNVYHMKKISCFLCHYWGKGVLFPGLWEGSVNHLTC
jgi:hypothetical protein